MTIYEELKKDHRKVLSLLDELIAAEKADSKKCLALVEQIRDELIPHARAEEAVLYNAIRDIEPAKDVVGHAYREHMEAETLLRGLQISEGMKMNWITGARKLKEAIQHHIQEEEGEVFAAAKKLFIEEEAVAMAEVFNKMKPLIKKQTFAGSSMDMLVNMMPSRLREPFRKSQLPIAKAV